MYILRFTKYSWMMRHLSERELLIWWERFNGTKEASLIHTCQFCLDFWESLDIRSKTTILSLCTSLLYFGLRVTSESFKDRTKFQANRWLKIYRRWRTSKLFCGLIVSNCSNVSSIVSILSSLINRRRDNLSSEKYQKVGQNVRSKWLHIILKWWECITRFYCSLVSYLRKEECSFSLIL